MVLQMVHVVNPSQKNTKQMSFKPMYSTRMVLSNNSYWIELKESVQGIQLCSRS